MNELLLFLTAFSGTNFYIRASCRSGEQVVDEMVGSGSA
jgi:hypothetical protein